MNTNYLHCNPTFFNKPGYDSVIFDASAKNPFAHLLYIFVIWIDGKSYPIALIQAFNTYLGPPKCKDQELGFLCVGIRPWSSAEFISVRSIIWGALLVLVFEEGKNNEYFIMDLIDADMFLRCQDIHHGGKCP